jgi:hypothetical protein
LHRRIIHKVRFEWRKRFAQGSPRFILSRSRMRSRTGLASPVENQACGIAKYPRLRVHRSGHVTKASKETQKLAKDMMDQAIPADQRRLVPKIAWRRFLRVRTGTSRVRIAAIETRSRTSQQGDTVPLILRRNSWPRRRLRAEDALETFAVLQEDQNPQHASDQRGRDAARCHRQVKRKDVVELRSKQC